MGLGCAAALGCPLRRVSRPAASGKSAVKGYRGEEYAENTRAGIRAARGEGSERRRCGGSGAGSARGKDSGANHHSPDGSHRWVWGHTTCKTFCLASRGKLHVAATADKLEGA